MTMTVTLVDDMQGCNSVMRTASALTSSAPTWKLALMLFVAAAAAAAAAAAVCRLSR
jgi:hypothetical protein